MKKLFLLVAFLTLAAPQFAKADHPRHHRINGTELSIYGFVAALILGGAGYAVLRRRRAA